LYGGSCAYLLLDWFYDFHSHCGQLNHTPSDQN
jgi:hypothetical protein